MNAQKGNLGGVAACPPGCDGRAHREAKQWAAERLGQSTNAGLEQMGRSVHEAESLRIMLDKEQRVTSGFHGPGGFIPYPGVGACGLTFGQWLSERTQGASAVEDARKALDDSTEWLTGMRPQPETDTSATERTFTRQEVNTVIRALKAEVDQTTERPVLERLRRIFERME